MAAALPWTPLGKLTPLSRPPSWTLVATLRNKLLCVKWDVEPYTLTHPISWHRRKGEDKKGRKKEATEWEWGLVQTRVGWEIWLPPVITGWLCACVLQKVNFQILITRGQSKLIFFCFRLKNNKRQKTHYHIWKKPKRKRLPFFR